MANLDEAGTSLFCSNGPFKAGKPGEGGRRRYQSKALWPGRLKGFLALIGGEKGSWGSVALERAMSYSGHGLEMVPEYIHSSNTRPGHKAHTACGMVTPAHKSLLASPSIY